MSLALYEGGHLDTRDYSIKKSPGTPLGNTWAMAISSCDLFAARLARVAIPL